MIICFKCSRETKEYLDLLLRDGHYHDYAEVISLAVANLAILQDQFSGENTLVINEDARLYSRHLKHPNVMDNVDGHMPDGVAELQLSKGITTDEHPLKDTITIPAVFQLGGIEQLRPSLAELPSDVWTVGQEVPLDRWLFGQYNKLLPAKANCRALAHLLANERKGVPIGKAASEIAEQATILGKFLSDYDERNGLARDDALATAFPSRGTDAEKGRLRYANQFVASINKQGQVSGLLIDLKLVNYTGGKDPRLKLTKIGWQFAILPNPILDNTQETPNQKLSEQETSLLLDHIARSVPAENFAYRAVLAAIMEGADTPDKLDAVLQKYVAPAKKRTLSSSFLSSQRSGAISRMADLGLVERVRDGVRVLYVVTDSGKRYGEIPQPSER